MEVHCHEGWWRNSTLKWVVDAGRLGAAARVCQTEDVLMGKSEAKHDHVTCLNEYYCVKTGSNPRLRARTFSE